jgi:hypothetical protein
MPTAMDESILQVPERILDTVNLDEGEIDTYIQSMVDEGFFYIPAIKPRRWSMEKGVSCVIIRTTKE